MKKILLCCLLICSILFIPFSQNVKAETTDAELANAVSMRGVWVSTVGNLDFKQKQGSTSERDILKWKTYFLNILDKVEENNLNAIFFQVRPNNDAFYPSEYNAWSSYMLGYGKDAGWDPLEWMVNECHLRGIEFHAWLNPYRIGTLVGSDVDINISTEDELNQAKYDYAKNLAGQMQQTVNNPLFNFENLDEMYEDVMVGINGDSHILILNPASERVIDHIVNTVEEIVSNYDVDGIHYDDYFYTSGGFEKYSENRIYGEYRKAGGKLGIEDWRRDNVDRMVYQVSEVVDKVNKEQNKRVAFGISPAGVWAPGKESCNTSAGVEGGMNVPCGSYSSYSNLFADTKKWVEEEWIDYILPQVYSSLGDGNYEEVTEWWAEVVSKTDVKLYVGTALYNTVNGSFKQLEIYDQIKWCRANEVVKANVSGYVYFSYQSFISASDTALAFVRAYYGKGNVTPVIHEVSDPGNSAGSIKCIEYTDRFSITITETQKAKGYMLYAFDEGETQVFDNKHLVEVFRQTTGSAKHSYETADKTGKVFVLKTLNLNNEIVDDVKTISTSESIENQAPTISFDNFETKEYYLMGEVVEVTLKVTDDAEGELTVTMYHAIDGENFKNGEVLEEISKGVYLANWEAFSISEEEQGRLKFVVSDGDKETEIITDYFYVYEKAPADDPVDPDPVDPVDPDTPTDPVDPDPVDPVDPKPSEDSGCKKDLSVVLISIISLLSISILIWKKEK